MPTISRDRLDRQDTPGFLRRAGVSKLLNRLGDEPGSIQGIVTRDDIVPEPGGRYFLTFPEPPDGRARGAMLYRVDSFEGVMRVCHGKDAHTNLMVVRDGQQVRGRSVGLQAFKNGALTPADPIRPPTRRYSEEHRVQRIRRQIRAASDAARGSIGATLLSSLALRAFKSDRMNGTLAWIASAQALRMAVHLVGLPADAVVGSLVAGVTTAVVLAESADEGPTAGMVALLIGGNLAASCYAAARAV